MSDRKREHVSRHRRRAINRGYSEHVEEDSKREEEQGERKRDVGDSEKGEA